MSKGLEKGNFFKKEQERERNGACRMNRKVKRRREGEVREAGASVLRVCPLRRETFSSACICHHH